MATCFLLIVISLINSNNSGGDKSIPTFLFAQKGINRTIPSDLLAIVKGYYDKNVGATSRALIKRHSKLSNSDSQMYDIELNGQDISKLYGWDFSEQPIAHLDLSDNALKTINDRVTKFALTKKLDLRYNQIQNVNLRNIPVLSADVVLDLSYNNITAESLISNEFLLPHGLQEVDLSHNPIGSISNFGFPSARTVTLLHCGISSLQNVVFNAKAVCLTDNPLKLVQNVTFNDVEVVYMSGCKISMADFQKFEWKFISKKPVSLWMCGNNFNDSHLHQHDYRLPVGVGSITTTYENVYHHDTVLVDIGATVRKGLRRNWFLFDYGNELQYKTAKCINSVKSLTIPPFFFEKMMIKSCKILHQIKLNWNGTECK